VLYPALILAIAAASISVALWVTPMQSVSAAGQTVQVGATAPSFGLSGPGQVDLFGQQLPTVIDFVGPVRPRLALSRITLSQQLAEVARSGSTKHAEKQLEDALVRGWTHYFYWEIAVVAGAALLLTGAVAGWLRRGRRSTIILLVVGVVVSEAINVGAIMVTAYTAPDKLSHVTSLQALVGASPPSLQNDPPQRRAPAASVEDAVVLGDSTAAALGNPPLPHPSADDKACRRSVDAYALVLARANDWHVTNLACSGATIAAGLLGPQHAGGRTLPPQLDNPAVANADAIFVSIGANDVHWEDLLRVCAVTKDCANNAETAYFQKQLAGFSRDYLRLIGALQVLPRKPRVVVNLYYDPFVGNVDCLAKYHVTAEKLHAISAELDAVNTVLRQGAQAAGFAVAQPNFEGHGLCSAHPYVQGVDDPAPFHPTAGGELAIALADERAVYHTGR
jgi:lysophospholipase L1-like esterase